MSVCTFQGKEDLLVSGWLTLDLVIQAFPFLKKSFLPREGTCFVPGNKMAFKYLHFIYLGRRIVVAICEARCPRDQDFHNMGDEIIFTSLPNLYVN